MVVKCLLHIAPTLVAMPDNSTYTSHDKKSHLLGPVHPDQLSFSLRFFRVDEKLVKCSVSTYYHRSDHQTQQFRFEKLLGWILILIRFF